MRRHIPGSSVVVVLVVAVVIVSMWAGSFATATAPKTTPDASPMASPRVAVNEVPSGTPIAGSIATIGVDDSGDDLDLTRVELPPGAGTGAHVHMGTRILYVERGTVNYRLESGEARLFRDNGPTEGEELKAGPDAWVTLKAGDRVAESTGAAHEYRNDGDEPAVVLIWGVYPPVRGCAGGCY